MFVFSWRSVKSHFNKCYRLNFRLTDDVFLFGTKIIFFFYVQPVLRYCNKIVPLWFLTTKNVLSIVTQIVYKHTIAVSVKSEFATGNILSYFSPLFEQISQGGCPYHNSNRCDVWRGRRKMGLSSNPRLCSLGYKRI